MSRHERHDDLFDHIGYWSEIKLEIIKEYAAAYSKILTSAKPVKFSHVYIDGFCAAGEHRARQGEQLIPGSPLNALAIDPPFRRYYLVDLVGEKIDHLRSIVGQRSDVCLLQGDCNKVLLDQVFPNVRYQDYRRGLCILDPYGLHLDWQVIEAAGKMRTLDVFLNFPIMDINRNALWTQPDRVDAASKERMTAFWGDDSWRVIAYRKQRNLFGTEEIKRPNDAVVQAFRDRLKRVAGFARVPDPLPMQKPVAEKVAKSIFAKYANRTK